MLIRFSVENFLSFAEKQNLYLTAVNTCKERAEENTFEIGGKTLLKSAVLYGANASGKSNLILALNFLYKMVRDSSKDFDSSERIPVIPFLLNSELKNRPSKFEIEFFLNEKKYFYGFHATEERIVREWLYEQGKCVFERAYSEDEDVIQVENIWKKASGLEERTRKNALFLSVCAQFAVPEAEEISFWFYNRLHILAGEMPERFRNYTAKQYFSGSYREDILGFLRNADTHIVDLIVKEQELEQRQDRNSTFAKKKKFLEIICQHNVYDNAGKIVDQAQWPLEFFESLGTQKALALSGPVIDTLKNGAILVVDELDSRLHPVFTRQIIRLFNSKKTNPLNAQLIFNTHDTNLLSYKIYDEKTEKEDCMFRRDQIYFTEKDNRETTHIYSLIEFKKNNDRKVRNDASFEKEYLNGVYGAIPFIGKLVESKEEL